VIDDALLDDADALAEADTHRTLRSLAMAGAAVREAAEQFSPPSRLVDDGRPRTVLVAGLGGSAFVGDALAALAGPASPVPVTSRRGGPLPGWAGPLDLVIAVSVSGHAPQVTSLAGEAARRGARVFAVTTERSPLARLVEATGGTLWPLRPGRTTDFPALQTRSGVWSLLTPVLVAADALGLVDVPPRHFAEAADRLDIEAEANRPSSPAFVNPAKSLAVELDGTVPVVLADGDLAQAAAARATTMLARAAKVPAVRGTLPDDASDVVALFDGPLSGRDRDPFADPFVDGPASARMQLVLLSQGADGVRAAVGAPQAVPAGAPGGGASGAAAVAPVRDLALGVGVRVSQVEADPGPALARLAQLAARVDFAATYLALGSGLDPGRSPSLADLRDRWRDGD
jgi:hypothetical protein